MTTRYPLADAIPGTDVLRCGAPHITAEDRAVVDRVVGSGWLGAGPMVDALESALEAFTHQGEVVTFSSATAAMAATLRVRGVGPGSTVVVGAFGFAAVVNAVYAVGARPIFVDTTEDGSTLDPQATADALAAGADAVVPLAWGGAPSDTATLSALCSAHGAVLLEDGAYALGSVHDDPDAFSPRCPVAISFHPTKIITGGLGGAVLGVTPDEAARLRSVRNQGLSRSGWARNDNTTEYAYSCVGFALEMSDMHAGLALSQLGRLPDVIGRRRTVAQRLTELIPADLVGLPDHDRTCYGRTNASMFAVLLPRGADRSAVRRRMLDLGVGTAVHYPFLAAEPAADVGVDPARYPHARDLGARTLTLPNGPNLSEDSIERIAGALRAALRAALRV